MRAPILLPAILARLGTLRPFLAITNGLQAIRRYALLDQEILGGGSAAIAQRQVIFSRSALVAMPFHHHREIRVLLEDLLQQCGIMRESVAPISANFAHIQIEEGILGLLLQQVRARKTRRGGCRWR